MRGTERVSVIIPTYNRVELLRRAVESVLAQTRPADEILIVDDGSTDGTREMCRDLPAVVRYIHQENAGVSAARNRGIREASGVCLAFLDSDDEWRPEKLEVQLALHRVHPEIGWSITNCEVIDLQGRVRGGRQGFRWEFPIFRDLDLDPDDFFGERFDAEILRAAGREHRVFVGDAFEAYFHGNFTYPSSLMISPGALHGLELFDEGFRVAEEMEFCHRLAARASLGVLMTPLIGRRVAEYDSLIAPHRTVELVRNALRSVDRAARIRPLSPGEAEAHRRGRERLLLRLGYAHLTELERLEARGAVVRAWREGVGRSPRAAGIFLASLLPVGLLRGLHVMKRTVRGRSR